MANTLDQFTAATDISDTDLLHVKSGQVNNSVTSNLLMGAHLFGRMTTA